MTKRLSCLRSTVGWVTLSLCCAAGTASHAQGDLKGGASGVGSPPNPPVRRSKRPKSTQPNPAAGRNERAQPQPTPAASARPQPVTTTRPVASPQPVAPKASISDQVEDALEKGNAARDASPARYDDAEREYKLAAQLDPKEARSFAGLGNVYFDQKRYADAEAAFRRAVELNSADGPTFVSLASTYIVLERYAEAERAARRAMALMPNDARGYTVFALSNYRRKSYQEAESAYRRALELSPKAADSYADLIRVLIEQSRHRETPPLFRKALELSPNDTSLLINYGRVLQQLGQLSQAAEQYQRVIQLDAKATVPRSKLGLIYYTQGETAKAREQWEATVKLETTDALDRIGLLVLDRKLNEAVTQLDQYTQARAGDEDGWLMLGDVRRAQGDEANASAAYARARQIAPDYAQLQRPTFLVAAAAPKPAPAPDPVTGAFEGRVTDSRSGAPILNATVEFTNGENGASYSRRTDAEGRFSQGALQPGNYKINVSAPGYEAKEVAQRLPATKSNTVVPLPLSLEPKTVAAAAKPTTKAKAAPPPEGSGSSAKPTPRYASVIQEISPFNPAQPTFGKGTFSVEALPGTTVLVELVGGKVAQIATFPRGPRFLSFNNLAPGTYRVAAALEGHHPTETEVFAVVSKVVTIKLLLRPKQ